MSRRSKNGVPLREIGAILPLVVLLASGLGCAAQDPWGRQVETVSGDWIDIYFTTPRYSDSAAHTSGLDADLVALIESAQESVDVAAYDLDLESVADALVRAQDDGVQVRLVTDEANAGEEAVVALREARVPVVARPEGWGLMHNKFVVVDEMRVWTGSWNLTENGTYRNNNNAVLITSPTLAQDYTVEFEEMFAGRFGPSSPDDTPHPLVTIQQQQERSTDLEVYFSPEDGIADRILQLLSSATSTVRFMAYQFTSDAIADALIDLAGKGLTVQGVMEARSANSAYSQYGWLQAGGVDVFEDGNSYIMHHKVLIIDDQTVVLGSYNFTGNAEENNDENLLVIHDSEVTEAFLAEFGRVLQEAQTAGP